MGVGADIIMRRIEVVEYYDNDGYCQGKDAFVKNMEQKALVWHREKEKI